MEKGSVVKIDYEMWVEGSEKLFDTTKEDAARNAGIHNPQIPYAPLTTIIGDGRLIKGFDSHLLAAEIGKDYEVAISAKDAYGAHDPSKVQTIPLIQFKKQNVKPHVDMQVNLGQTQGRISRITDSRAFVDCNHPLAGKSLRYRYTVVGEAKDPCKKAGWIMKANYPREVEFESEIDGKSVTIKVPEPCKYDVQMWPLAKYRAVGDLRNFGGFENVFFVEEYIMPQQPEKEVVAEGKKED